MLRGGRKLGALLLWAILIPALGRSAWGQNSVSGAIQGFVYDKDDRSPVLEAKIVITNQATGVSRAGLSQSDGSYTVSMLSSGTYTIKCTHPDYEPDTHRPVSVVLGKTIPYFVVSLTSALGIVVVSMVLFGLPMRGSWFVLVLALSLFLVGALGLGLLISSVAETQQVAFQAALLASFLPTLMLSGFIFPIASMPRFLQLVTYIVPARYFLVALRGIVLKGAGLNVYWVELAALVVFALAVLTLASVRLQRQWT